MTDVRRVVIATRLFAPEPAAAAIRLSAVARALARAGVQVDVLTSRYKDAPHTETGNIRVRRFPVLRDKDGAVRGYVPYLSFDLPLVFRLLLTRKPDVIVVEPPPTTGAVVRVVAGVRRIPYVYYAADLMSASAAGMGLPAPVRRLAHALESFALRGARSVLAVNNEVAQACGDLGVNPENVAVVSNGVDTDLLTPTGHVEQWSAPTFVYAGSANAIHGAEVFVEAFGIVQRTRPEVRMVFVGRGADWDVLRDRALRDHGDAVSFTEAVNLDRLAELLRGAVAGLASVRPGQGYDYALATKALAVAATGAPVVFAGQGHTAQIVRRGNLGEVAAWEPEAVAAAMIRCLDAPAEFSGRRDRADWVDTHASLRSVGEAARRIILNAAR